MLPMTQSQMIEIMSSDLFGSFVSKYYRSLKRYGYEYEDLKQEGFLVIVRAVNYYCPNSDAEFSTYLWKCLDNHFKGMYLCSKSKEKILKDYENHVKSCEEYLIRRQGYNMSLHVDFNMRLSKRDKRFICKNHVAYDSSYPNRIVTREIKKLVKLKHKFSRLYSYLLP